MGVYELGSTPIPELEFAECVINDGSMDSLRQFVKCFRYFVSKSIFVSCLVLCFSFLTVVLNLAVIVFIFRLKAHKTVFDKIFIGHCIVDGLVGLLVVPNYCIYFVFGYWPLGKLLCHFYVSLDYTICHVGILHMVFVAYARLRSLQAPKKYNNELIISHAKLTMLVLWLISGVLWLPAVNVIINLTFKNRECYFNYDPAYIIMQDTIAYLLPMLIILAITAYILKTLHVRNKRRRMMKRKKNMHLPKLIMLERKKAALKNDDLDAAKNIQNLINRSENMSMGSELSLNTDDAAHTTSNLNEIIIPNECIVTKNGKSIIATGKKSPATNAKKVSIKKKPSKPPAPPPMQNQFSTMSYVDSFSGLVNGGESSYAGNGDNGGKNAADVTRISDENNSRTSRLRSKLKTKTTSCSISSIKLNAYAKLYIIIATFCVLWLPFCILWPINSVCPTCISAFVYQLSYWMGYAQSLINPVLLLILNPNYNKLKMDN